MSDNHIVRGQKGDKNGFCILDLIPMTSTHSYFVFSSVHTTYGTILSVTTTMGTVTPSSPAVTVTLAPPSAQSALAAPLTTSSSTIKHVVNGAAGADVPKGINVTITAGDDGVAAFIVVVS